MSWYQGKGKKSVDTTPTDLPVSLLEHHTDPDGYLADDGLADAVNVALHLGQPLLLTGPPGTGKTQLAYSLAWELGFEKPEKFETKSTSVSRDLFYTYDTLGRFQAAQSGEGSIDPVQYLRFNALGIAILYAAKQPDKVSHLLPEETQDRDRRRSVVLIDEIDKAPRDFPNDLLNEVEHMYFRIPELGNLKVEADPDLRPVLVMTSNSEKNLPEAFLRRCVFYDIPFPEGDQGRSRLIEILASRLGAQITSDTSLLDDALEVFSALRSGGLEKRPSIGELLAWLQLLVARRSGDGTGIRDRSMIEPALSALIKTRDDRKEARELLEEWLKQEQA